MGRHNADRNARGGRRARPERPIRGGRKRSSDETDELALRRRETGASYSAIARGLELPRAADAYDAFIRALRRREGEERRLLVARESERLDQLEVRIRERDAAEPDKVARRLLGVGHLREALA